jgi:hypothetical protein
LRSPHPIRLNGGLALLGAAIVIPGIVVLILVILLIVYLVRRA